MTKLSQIVAVEKGVKSRATRDFTTAHRLAHTPQPLSGISRSYQPRADDGESLPSESTRVQHTVPEINAEVERTLTRLFDVTATKDWANTTAKADVVVNGDVLLEAVPVPYLLFLEKQLNDLRTYVEGLPTLDPSEVWVPDDQPGVYRTEPTQTTRTRKVPRNHVRAEATKEHPAQVDVFTEDVVIGDWTTIKRSGALSEGDRAALVERVDDLQRAVKYAREQANSTDIVDMKVGLTVFRYLFGGVVAS
jgi:hypothetical protein